MMVVDADGFVAQAVEFNAYHFGELGHLGELGRVAQLGLLPIPLRHPSKSEDPNCHHHEQDDPKAS